MKKYFNIISFLMTFFLISSCKGDNTQIKKRNTIAQQINSIEFESLISEGQKYLENMQLNKAKEVFLKAIDINPNKPDGYYGLGVCYTINCQVNGKDCEKGIKYLDKVLRMDAKYRRAYYNRAICRDKLGDSQGAIDDLNIQISLDNTDPDYYHNRALIKLSLGDTSAACYDFRKSYGLGNLFDKVAIDSLCN